MRGTTKKNYRQIAEGIAYIKATFNNTIITITDNHGNTLVTESGGTSEGGGTSNPKFSGARKGTPYAALLAGRRAGKTAYTRGMKRVFVKISGPGPGRESAIRGLKAGGPLITKIEDVTGIPHNGVRPSKKRRV